MRLHNNDSKRNEMAARHNLEEYLGTYLANRIFTRVRTAAIWDDNYKRTFRPTGITNSSKNGDTRANDRLTNQRPAPASTIAVATR